VRTAAARPPVLVEIGGVVVRTTERRAKIIEALRMEPRRLSDMCRAGLAPQNNALIAQIKDVNVDLEKAGTPLRIVALARPPRTGARGSVAPLYALVDPAAAARPATESKNADPNNPPSVQSEAEAGSSPEEEADASAGGEGDHIVPAQSAPFVMPASGEGSSSVESPPAADGPLPESPAAKPAPERKPLTIGLGMLIGVDLVACHVAGPAGDYKVSGQKMAKTLDLLRGGLMYGLDIVAKRCGWQSAEVARSALQLERDRLASIGIDMHLDKINVRLREAS
jgi:hypothetical protein